MVLFQAGRIEVKTQGVLSSLLLLYQPSKRGVGEETRAELALGEKRCLLDRSRFAHRLQNHLRSSLVWSGAPRCAADAPSRRRTASKSTAWASSPGRPAGWASPGSKRACTWRRSSAHPRERTRVATSISWRTRTHRAPPERAGDEGAPLQRPAVPLACSEKN